MSESSMREAKIQKDFLDWARKTTGVLAVKYQASIYGTKGTPDVILCVKGKFVAIEFKREGEEARRLQDYRMMQVRKNGGISEVVDNLEDAKQVVLEALE